MAKAFPIPAALHDLERAPYHLLPYPEDFDDDDEAARAESFDALVLYIESSNRTIASATIALFESEDDDEFPITASTSPIIPPARVRVPFDHDLFRAPELPASGCASGEP